MEQRDWDENWHERANSILTTYQQRRYGKNYRIAVYCHDDYCHFGYFGIASHETHALMHAREGKSCSICIPEAHQRISNVEPNYDAIINAKLIQHANHIHPGMLIQHYLRYHQIIIHYCILCGDRFMDTNEYLNHRAQCEVESPIVLID